MRVLNDVGVLMSLTGCESAGLDVLVSLPECESAE